MRRYTAGDTCLMELLQEVLDDPHAEPCGRCSVCRDGLPEGLTDRPDPATVRAVAQVLRGEVQVLEPRKMWPGGVFGSRGRIAAEELPEPGRVLVHADAPEWREVVAEAFGTGERTGAALEELADACVRLLGQWRTTWAARPEVVVDLAAAGHEPVVAAVADHLARVGRLERASLPVAGAVPESRQLSSAEEAARWRDLLTPAVPVDDVRGRVVLLVVDASSSLWPVTVASALLRRSGTRFVLPLLLHRRP